MKIYIKNMVCERCKLTVREELERLGLPYNNVDYGVADLRISLTEERKNQLNAALKKTGLELMDDKKSMLIEKIKLLIVDLVHYSNEPLRKNLSDYISEKLDYDYTYLSNLFSEVQGTTIEKFFILHKIEKVKELLVYDEMNLKEIAFKLHYSSVAHLSSQFKKQTGYTPSHFKHLKNKKRVPLEHV